MRVIILLLCLLASQAWTQTNLSVFCALNPRTEVLNNQENILNQYWRNGVSLGAGYETAISTNISISSTIETAYYKWDKFDYRGPMIPELRLQNAHGEDSRV